MEEDNHDSGEFVQPPPEVFRSTAVGFKKKRGRPRNYTVALSPMPISASIPPTGGWKYSQEKPYVNRKQKLEFCTPTVRCEQVAYSYGPNFTPHVVTVNFGEDVNMKIISFAQQGSKAICVLAANGSISNVTLRQPDSSGGTLTYEGRFDILSLSGAFVSNDCGGAKGLSGGMSVSLAGPDGRVLGGGLAGMLVAAGPIQVILGSFLQGHQQEQQNVKKSRFEFVPTISPPVMAATPIFKETTERARGDEPNINFTITSPTRGLGPENNGSEPKVVSTSMFGASC